MKDALSKLTELSRDLRTIINHNGVAYTATLAVSQTTGHLSLTTFKFTKAKGTRNTHLAIRVTADRQPTRTLPLSTLSRNAKHKSWVERTNFNSVTARRAIDSLRGSLFEQLAAAFVESNFEQALVGIPTDPTLDTFNDDDRDCVRRFIANSKNPQTAQE